MSRKRQHLYQSDSAMSKPETTSIRHRTDPGGGRLIDDEPVHVDQTSSAPQTAFPASTPSLSKGTLSTSPAASVPIPVQLGASTNPTQTASKARSSTPPPPPPRQNSFIPPLPPISDRPPRISQGSYDIRPPIPMAALRDGSTPTNRISRAKKGKRVHECNHPGCEKIFTRAEHLRRHQLNHSTEVYYKCDMCEKTFVRQDLLSRHTERHATQARKAVQTLALAQRHRHFTSQFGINVPMLTQPPTSDYGGSNSHLFDTNSHSNPQLMAQNHSAQTASIVAHAVSNYVPNFPTTSMPLSGASESPLDFASTDSTPSPSGSLRRAHLPFHLQHNEPQRQPGQYLMPITSHPETVRQPLAVSVDQQQQQQQQQPYPSTRQLPTWGDYVWLFDEIPPDQLVMSLNQNQDPALAYIHHLEATHYHGAGLLYDPSNNMKGATPVFHHLDESMRTQVLMLLRDVPYIHTGNASPTSMQNYLRLYWTKFHPMFPILHRPTFFPSMQMCMLVAMVLAIGASFGDNEACNFAAATYEKVKGWIMNSEDFATPSPNNVYIQQLLLLTDIFGKLRSQRTQLDNSQLDLMLLNNIRRSQSLSGDPLVNVRRYQAGGLEFNYQNEWQTWIELESRKRVALIFFIWDTQQATLFGRSMCQTAFDLRMQLPCEEFLWNADTPTDWIKGLEGQQEYPEFLDTLKIFLDCRRQPPALSPLSSTLVLHGLISIGLDLQGRSSPIAPSPGETAAKQAKLLRGFEVWRGQFEELLGQILVEPWYQKIMSMYHMAYIILHTNIHNLLAVAGDRRLSGRNMNDFYRVKHEMQQWASVPSAQLATWHSLRILLPYLSRSQLYSQELYVSWCTYVAALVCWAYGQLSPPSIDPNGLSEVPEDEFMWDPHPDMRIYLQQMDTDTWERLGQVRGYKRRTGGLLAVVSSAMESTRWGFLKESHEILKRINPTRSARGV